MNTQVVVAGVVGTRILDRVMGSRGAPWATVREAGDRSDAIIYASTLVSPPYNLTTVLVLDSNTLENAPLDEQRSTVEHLVRPSSAETGFKLVLAVPQVEAVLFADRAGLERAIGRGIADDDFFEARFRPKAVFRRLLGPDDCEEHALVVIDRLDAAALTRMAQHPVIQEIAAFIEEVAARGEYQEPFRRAG